MEWRRAVLLMADRKLREKERERLRERGREKERERDTRDKIPPETRLSGLLLPVRLYPKFLEPPKIAP
jgi:hypothetical protein